MNPVCFGRRLSLLVQEAVDGNPRGNGWFTPPSKKRKAPETGVGFDSRWENDMEIEVVKRSRAVAPQVGENLEMAVLKSKAEEEQLDLDFWIRAALKKAEDVTDLKEQVKELQEEVEVWRKEAKTLAIELETKDLAMQALRRTEEQRVDIEDTANRSTSESLQTALQDTGSKYCQLAKELSETHLRSVESARLPIRGATTEALNVAMNPQKKMRVGMQELERSVDDNHKRLRL